MQKNKLRYAALGTGYWSTLQIPAWTEAGGVELVALYNRTVSKAHAVAPLYGYPRVYENPESLFREEQLDFVDIITEVPGHEPLVTLAAKYRVPVICQKPMSSDLESCERMVNLCREAGIAFFIHENFRWQPPFRKVGEMLSSGVIGTPYRAHIQMSYGGMDTFRVQPFLKTLKYLHHMDMGPHLFDLARFYFGEAESIVVQTSCSVDGIAGEDMFAALLHMGPTLCVCEIGNHIENRVYIEGDSGWMKLDLNSILTIWDGRKETRIDTKTWPRYSWVKDADDSLHGGDCIHSIVACNRHFRECLLNGSEAETSGRYNLETMRLVFAAIESSRTRQQVRLPSICSI